MRFISPPCLKNSRVHDNTKVLNNIFLVVPGPSDSELTIIIGVIVAALIALIVIISSAIIIVLIMKHKAKM